MIKITRISSHSLLFVSDIYFQPIFSSASEKTLIYLISGRIIFMMNRYDILVINNVNYLLFYFVRFPISNIVAYNTARVYITTLTNFAGSHANDILVVPTCISQIGLKQIQ